MANVTGGDKLQAYLTEIAGNMTNAGNDPSVRVGFLESASYPNGQSVATVAFWNEFGNGKAPPRPFFRRMIKANAKAWPDEIATVLKSSGYDAAKTLKLMGERIAGQLRQAIVDLVDPALAASTIARKGFSKPLIGGAQDSGGGGVMLRSVDYEVST